MKIDPSRRGFLRTGLALPAAGLVASQSGEAFQQSKPLPHRTLGKTGLKVCPVGVGVGFTPDPSVIARAVDLGVNLFDTANDYSNGNSERLLTVGLKGIPRDKVIIVSKTPAKTRADFMKDLEDSLKNLATDRVDIWLLHAKSKPEEVPDELLKAGDDARKQGKIRFYGVSTHDIDAMADHFVKAGNIDAVTFTYNFTMGTAKEASIAKLHKAGIGLTAMKVMAANGGVLPDFSRMMNNGGRAAGAGAGGGQARPAMPPRPAAIKNPLPALKWVVKNPMVATTIPGVRDIEMLEMNLRALTEPYTPEDEKLLVARSEEIRPYYCRMCYRCEGQCPKGVPVTDELRILAYADFYGDFPFAQKSFSRLPAEARAVRCSDCSQCAVDCPNGVHVADRLIRAQEILA
jgi:aryl-alcohol dehydrogenase-like predicted oxidoreductase